MQDGETPGKMNSTGPFGARETRAGSREIFADGASAAVLFALIPHLLGDQRHFYERLFLGPKSSKMNLLKACVLAIDMGKNSRPHPSCNAWKGSGIRKKADVVQTPLTKRMPQAVCTKPLLGALALRTRKECSLVSRGEICMTPSTVGVFSTEPGFRSYAQKSYRMFKRQLF